MTHADLIEILEANEILYSFKDGWLCVGGSYVFLDGLTTLPENVKFENTWDVCLNNLTALPENVKFKNGWSVYLPNLTAEPQMYMGKLRRFRTIDGFTMLMGPSRKAGEYIIHKARYFGGGAIENLEQCYIAEKNDTFAHGDTAEDAMRDLRFKIAQVNYDASELIGRVRQEQKIGFDDFRLLTGACLSGLQHGLEQLGLSPDTENLPLPKAMELVRGKFGERRMIEAFGELK